MEEIYDGIPVERSPESRVVKWTDEIGSPKSLGKEEEVTGKVGFYMS